MRKLKDSERGIATLETIASVMVITVAFLIWYFNSNHTNLESTLISAKYNALQQAQITGGLTPGIINQVKTSLIAANADPSAISVTSPQTTPVPYANEIEIDIFVTSNQTTGVDQNGKAAKKTTTLHAQGFILSQYSP